MRRTVLALVVGLPLANGAAYADDGPLPVVASFSILGDMVQEIGGSRVALTTLVGHDGDAHVYEPTPTDAKTLAAARLLVVNGLHFEGWLPRLTDAAGFAGETVVASAGIVPRSFGDHAEEHHDESEEAHADDDHGHGAVDPHAWQDLANGVIYARNIGAGLAKADPAHAAEYAKATEAYVARLQALDADVKARLSAVPDERRKVVTSHDAFGYFSAAYGVTFIAPVGTSTDAEASAADVARIIDQIRREKIAAVFVENVTNTKLVDQISSETGATVGGALYSDALSGPDGPAATYEKMFDWNVTQLTQAMTGS
ncbi:metal ABC transporter substrate-binding protein [Geminicoccus sp.]|uniref:metal ABC transporter substrate-binding protein n=1 Tax=Geminicoccus sp. TaxID=2024832 RepID=UPI0039C89FAD